MSDSPQIEKYKSLLPEDMQKRVSHVSQSKEDFYGLLENNLKAVYGDYVDWEQAVKNFYRDAGGCRKINEIEDIPELSRDDLQGMLQEENQDIENINKFKEDVEILKNEGNTVSVTERIDLFNACAKFCGIYPELTEDAFFKYFLIRPEDSSELFRCYQSNQEHLGIFFTLMGHLIEPGMTVEYKDVGAVVTQQMRKYYYRGENDYYGRSKASMYRGLENSQNESLEILIRNIRQCECWNFFDQFDAVKHWGISAVNYMALAQHYGVRSPMIDLTSNLRTALFFMCCKYINGKWYPLTETDIANERYGILYRGLKEILDLDCEDSVVPIGYQPFMRCNTQYGYMLMAKDKDYDLYQDYRFEKFKVKLTPDLCNWIYQEMDEGEKIYPSKDISNIENYVTRINRTKVFSKSVVKNLAELWDINFEWFQVQLRNKGYSVKEKTDWISPGKLRKINEIYGIDVATKNMGEISKMAPMITITAC